jgi:hypothetical protein
MPSPLDAICEAKGVTVKATLVHSPINRKAKGEDWKQSAYHFSVVLIYKGRSMVTEWWSGHGNEIKGKHLANLDWTTPAKPPKVTAAGVLYGLILDSSALDMGFEDWCGDFGYDTDSRKALELYHECQRMGKKVRALLGSDFDAFRDAEH